MSDIDAFDEVIDEAAAAAGIERTEVLMRALIAIAEAEGVDVPSMEELETIEDRLVELETAADGSTDGEELTDDRTDLHADISELHEDVADLSAQVSELAEDLDELSDDLSEVRNDTEEKIEDVRTRLVRIYREAEQKAPADHDHPELASTVETLRETVAELEDRTTDGSPADAFDAGEDNATSDAVGELRGTVADLADRIESMESTVEGGEVDTDVSEKLSRIANAVVSVQRRLRVVERRTTDAETLTRLTALANTHGIRKAACTHCEETVRLTLLTAPRCPHCDREFSDLTPKSGFFGTSRLIAGDPPALEGEVAGSGDAAGSRGSGTDDTGSVPTEGPGGTRDDRR
ncbi:hypothetical protein [Halorubrum vacuolatum]|uniref:Uncharacterized protein n=1 Tax=Halorubrum vacuolatum TaxID=63740 RepID=A0A238XNX9_HALVU|nr:hypothetical protein [Halorubrum vacuolatum]SNR60153.1 hypothetical protein SAMN06264855_12020 [Halorubrum vacuolatum]